MTLLQTIKTLDNLLENCEKIEFKIWNIWKKIDIFGKYFENVLFIVKCKFDISPFTKESRFNNNIIENTENDPSSTTVGNQLISTEPISVARIFFQTTTRKKKRHILYDEQPYTYFRKRIVLHICLVNGNKEWK